MEYWTTHLTGCVLIFILSIASICACSFWLETEGIINGYLYPACACALLTLILIIGLVFLLVRRLHDIGRSGWWVSAAILLSIICFVFYMTPICREVYFILQKEIDYCEMMEAMSFVDEEHTIMSPNYLTELCGWVEPEASLERVDRMITYPFMGCSALVQFTYYLLSIGHIVLSMVLFCFCFVDSERGTNRYGLSYKYPVA